MPIMVFSPLNHKLRYCLILCLLALVPAMPPAHAQQNDGLLLPELGDSTSALASSMSLRR